MFCSVLFLRIFCFLKLHNSFFARTVEYNLIFCLWKMPKSNGFYAAKDVGMPQNNYKILIGCLFGTFYIHLWNNSIEMWRNWRKALVDAFSYFFFHLSLRDVFCRKNICKFSKPRLNIYLFWPFFSLPFTLFDTGKQHQRTVLKFQNFKCHHHWI